ncbi:hypothetical protein ACF090_36675 [Streptomyces sp. NPDC014892]|uniref:hypothetical protein n=1 Tax=Streptomyces sp. NPDC014892 TaxID=3364930 RepID=UPI0036FCAE47
MDAAPFPHADTPEPSTPALAPVAGDLAYDTVRDRYGIVMERAPGQVHLRPRGGGREWTARPEHVELARAGEALSSRVARVNARSRGEVL